MSEPLPTGFWDRRLARPDGGELVLESLRGRPLLVNFWATWCPPCVDELPLLDRFARAQEAQGSRFQVLGVAVDQPQAVRTFLQRMPLGFPIGLAGQEAGLALGRQLGNHGGLPFSVLIRADGLIAQRKIGRLTPEMLASWARMR